MVAEEAPTDDLVSGEVCKAISGEREARGGATSTSEIEKQSEGGQANLVPFTREEAILETVAAVSGLVPVLGGPVASILTGIAGDRRLARVSEVLKGLSKDLHDLTEEQEGYIRSEDFEDILFETLQRVASERNAEKRAAYRKFLMESVMVPSPDFDEQVQILRVLEEVQQGHIAILRAAGTPPPARREGEEMSIVTGALRLGRRAGISEDHAYRISLDLDRLGLTIDLPPALRRTPVSESLADFRKHITPFGVRFLEHLTGTT